MQTKLTRQIVLTKTQTETVDGHPGRGNKRPLWVQFQPVGSWRYVRPCLLLSESGNQSSTLPHASTGRGGKFASY